MKKILVHFCVLSMTVILSGCSGGKQAEGPVIAQVNKSSIQESEFIQEISRVPEWAREQFNSKEGKNKFLDELIKRELIYQNALRMRLDKDREYLDKLDEFKKMSLVALTLKKEVDDKVKIDDAEVRAFYDNNEGKFTIGTKIRASHILVKSEEEAKGILDKISKGESFEAVAKKNSLDKASAAKGGDLGYFGSGQMVPEFEQAAIRLKPGEVSEPVRTRFGYHIIRLADVKKGELASFDQSRDAIRKELVAQKRKKLFEDFVAKLMSSSTISKKEDVLDKVALPWGQSQEQQPAPEPEGK